MSQKWLAQVIWAVTVIVLTTSWQAQSPAVAQEGIGLYVDGKPIETLAAEIWSPAPVKPPWPPPVLVDGHAMIALRFLYDLRFGDLDLHMVDWGIMRLGNLTFKIGLKEVRWPVPKIGGHARGSRPLPVAPRIINGRLYVPARVTLNLLRHAVEWDATERALCIIRDGAPEKRP